MQVGDPIRIKKGTGGEQKIWMFSGDLHILFPFEMKFLQLAQHSFGFPAWGQKLDVAVV